MLIVLRCPPTAEAATVAASTRIATTAIPPSVTAFLIRSLLEGLGSTTTIGIPTGGAGRPYAAPQLESRPCRVRFRAAGSGRATSSRLSDETLAERSIHPPGVMPAGHAGATLVS